MKRKFIILIIAGLILRLALLFLDFSFDVNSFMAWGKDLSIRGSPGFYQTVSSEVYSTKYPNYPPFSIFLFWLSHLFAIGIKNLAWFLNINISVFPSDFIFFTDTRIFTAGIFKIIPVLADLGIAWIIYLWSKRKSLLFPSLILFNPVFFYTSSLWGQIESISIFFALLSFYFLLYPSYAGLQPKGLSKQLRGVYTRANSFASGINSKKIPLSSLFLTLAVLSKQTTVIFIPIYLIILYKKAGLNEFLKTTLFAVFIFWLSFLPFYPTSLFELRWGLSKSGNILFFPFAIYYQKFLSASGIPFVSNHAFNFWALITGWKDILDTKIFAFNMSFRVWGYILTAIFTIPLLVIIYKLNLKSKIKDSKIFFALMLFAFSVFLFMTKIHERHFMQVLPFLLLIAIKEKRYLKYFVALSVFQFINLYHNWMVPRIEPVAQVILSPITVNLSIFGILIIFIILYLDCFKSKSTV